MDPESATAGSDGEEGAWTASACKISHTLTRAGAAATPAGNGGARWKGVPCRRVVVGSGEGEVEPAGVLLCMHATETLHHTHACTQARRWSRPRPHTGPGSHELRMDLRISAAMHA